MKKILAALFLTALTAGLFAQVLRPDTADVQQINNVTAQWSDFIKNAIPSTKVGLQDKKEFIEKMRREMRERDFRENGESIRVYRGAMAMRMGSGMEAEIKKYMNSVLFSYFERRVKNKDMDAVAAILNEYEKELNNDNKVDVAVFNNIKKFYEKSLSDNDPKEAFIGYVKYDSENSNTTYQDGYNRFFSKVSMPALKRPAPAKALGAAGICE